MALPTHIDLQVLTPDRAIVRDRVDEVEVPGAEGYFGVLPGHRPMLASLSLGELWYRKGEEKFYLAIAFGFAEVLPDRVTILARLAERPEDIDVERAEAARRRAEERLVRPQPDIDYERARVALTKSLMRLQVSARLPGGARVGELRRMRDAARG
ncbi:MAG: F0F1 ATP synthase subunit epsilon [Vicinamibacterales bacterium]